LRGTPEFEMVRNHPHDVLRQRAWH
jgi:hypothetical protein